MDQKVQIISSKTFQRATRMSAKKAKRLETVLTSIIK